MIYDDSGSGPEVGVMMAEIIEQPCYDDYRYGVSYASHLVDITWFSPFNGRNQLRDFTMAYGNNVSVG